MIAPASPRPPLSQNAIGALWLLVSVAGATVMTVAVRVMGAEMHTSMLAFLRSVLALLTLLPILPRVSGRGRAAARVSRPVREWTWSLHLARGVLLAVTLNSGYYAIWKLPLATASVLFFLAPVFATMLARPILGEHVGPRRWAATIAGFLGAVVILRPGMGAFEPAMIWAVVSALAFAVVLLIGRLATDRDGTDAVFVSSTVIVALATLPPALLHWSLPAGLWQWALLGVLVAASSLRTYADISAYAQGDAGFLAPFTYLRLITVGGAGYLLFGERVDTPTLIGGGMIVLSTLYIGIRERKRQSPRALPRSDA